MKTKVASAASIVAIVFFFSTATAQERASQSGSRRGVTVPASEVVNSGDSGPQHHAWTHTDATDTALTALGGFYRWFNRVYAYALLLTGKYPPFRLDD